MVEYDEGTDAFILKEIKLWEISPVTWSSGESAQLRSFRDHQMQAIINKYTREQISDLTNLLALRTATSTQEEKEDEFTKSLKLF